MEEVVSRDSPPTNQFLVAHFGNGDEDDQTLIQEYARKFGDIARITIFPGISYGHIEFKEEAAASKMIADFDSENVKVL